MKVVFITIPGAARQAFANNLYERIGKSLELVVVHTPRKRSVAERFVRFIKRHKDRLIIESWYALLLRLERRIEHALKHFTANSYKIHKTNHRARVLEVESVNGQAVHQALKEISPDLIVVWASTILEPHILATAPRAINLHFGLCPHYRGALANQYAVIRNDLSKLGATIHYINGKADAGEILATVSADTAKAPRELFIDLNDRAVAKFLDVVTALSKGEELEAKPQDISNSHNFLLKSWTPSVRYKLGKKVIEWEKEHSTLSQA